MPEMMLNTTAVSPFQFASCRTLFSLSSTISKRCGHLTTMLLTTLVILASSASSFGKEWWGGTCSQTRNRLNHGNYQLTTDCNAAFYCASNNTCAYKGCRRQDFPFGYNLTDTLPPRCGSGEFCPDEEDACLPLLPVGSPCQLNRDGATIGSVFLSRRLSVNTLR